MDFYIMLLVVALIALVVFIIYTLKSNRDNATKEANAKLYKAQAEFYNSIRQLYNTNMKIVNAMDGLEFEHFVAELLPDFGYRNVQVTKASGDQGADIIAEHDEYGRVCVQCKNYTGSVGFDAVQQIYTAKSLYACNTAMVITNSYFTKQAIETAARLGVKLCDGDELWGMMEASFEIKLEKHDRIRARKNALLDEHYGTDNDAPKRPSWGEASSSYEDAIHSRIDELNN